MMQYGISSFQEDGCQNCKFYTHIDAKCHKDDNANDHIGFYIGIGLSSCKRWILGYRFVPNSWGRFERIKDGKLD